MVILSPRIPRNASVSRALIRLMVGEIVHADRDHRSAAGQDLGWIGAPGRLAAHPGHRAVESLAKPFEKTPMQDIGKRGDCVL